MPDYSGAGFLSNQILIKHTIMKTLSLIIFLLGLYLVLAGDAFSQPYYYNSGDPSNTANWGNMPGGGGSNPPDFFQPVEYIIENTKNAVVNSAWSFGSNATTLRVNTGGTLTANAPVTIGFSVNFQLDSAASYIHNNTGMPPSTIYQGVENFNKKSSIKINNWVNIITGITFGVTPNPNGYYFGNLEINWEGCNGEWYQGLTTHAYLCENDFRVTSTGKGIFIFGANPNSANIIIIVRNYIQTGGEVDLALGTTLPNTFPTMLTISNSFQKTGGILDGNGGSSFGQISFASASFIPGDTTFQTFYNAGTTRRIRFVVADGCRLRLLSNLPLSTNNNTCGLIVGQAAALDCGVYQVSGLGPFTLYNNATLKMASPFGFKTSSSGNITTTGTKTFGMNDTLEYNGTSPQVLGDSLPTLFPAVIKVNNPEGVSLSKTTRITNLIKFVNGRLNVGDYNLIIPKYSDAVAMIQSGVSKNNFININGTGSVKFWAGSTGLYLIPVGSGTNISTVAMNFNTITPDSFSIRVANGFPTNALPGDTSYLAKKRWIIKENMPGESYAHVSFSFDTLTDAGKNFHFSFNVTDAPYIGVHDAGYDGGFIPYIGQYVSNLNVPNEVGINSTTLISTFNEDNFFIAGNMEGVYESFYYNAGEPSLHSSWTKFPDGTGPNPPNFANSKIMYVAQNKNAVFNSSAAFGSGTVVRAKGNGIITTNQPVTCYGKFELEDSAVYNHNNTGNPVSTIFNGYELFSNNSTLNFTMWSDTTHKLFDGLMNAPSLGNVTVNFVNLPNPLPGSKWRNQGHPLITGDLKLISSSGYDIGLVPVADFQASVQVNGNVQIGDTLNFPDRYAVLDLAVGTTQPAGQCAMSLEVGGNIDIQTGGIISTVYPDMARGRIIFNGGKKHTFYCYNPFQWQTFNLGNSNFPNLIYPNDTLVLKSDMYNSSQAPFLFTDVWEVQGVLDMGTYAVRSLNLRVKENAKVITRSNDGLKIALSTIQTADFQGGSTLEFAGTGPQNFCAPDFSEIKNIPSLKINNQSNLTMNIDSVLVSDSLVFQNGKLISSGQNYLWIKNYTKFNISNVNSFIDGPLKIIAEFGMPTKYLPLGKGNTPRTLMLHQFDNTYGEWLVEYFNTGQVFGDSLGPSLTNIINTEYYTINRLAGTASAQLGLHWGPSTGITSTENLLVSRWNGTMWENKGGYDVVGTPDSGFVVSQFVNDFSPFVIGKGSSVNPNDIIITEFRLGANDNVNDEFIEFYNTTDAPVYINTTDGTPGWAAVTSDGVSRFVIPAGTIIPAKGHYLVTNSNGYSLNAYPSGNGTTAIGDLTYASDIPQNTGIALFRSAFIYSPENRICAAGFMSSGSLYKEGAGITNLNGVAGAVDYSIFRIETTGGPKNTGDNAADFNCGDPNGTAIGMGQNLAAPGPQNLSSPVNQGEGLIVTFADPSLPVNGQPNFFRDLTSDPANNSWLGTLDFRFKIKNQTGNPITRLRFRLANLSTFPAPMGIADLRARTGNDINILVNGNNTPCFGTVVEMPPNQPNGSGLNSSMSINSISMGTPLANNDSIYVHLYFGCQQTGNINVSFIMEALADGSAGAEGTGSGISIPFTITGTDMNPLPVELTSFTAAAERNNVNLNWSTMTEINNSGFDIERKLISDSTWNKIGFIQGSGNTTQTKNYKYEDRNLITGKYNYRLKQIDYNGNFSYHNLQNEVNVGIPDKFYLSQNYPNPFNPSTKINFEVPKDSKVSLQIFDMTGRLVATLLNNQDHSAGYYTVQFNASAFASGTYFFRMAAGDFVQTKKMQLIK